MDRPLRARRTRATCEPLNQYIPLDTLKKFVGIDWCSKDLKVDTGAICVPLDLQFYNGFYNKDLFTQAGIDAFPTTWDELYAACDKLKAIGVTPMTYGTGLQALNAGFYPYYDLSYMMMMYSPEDWKKLYNGQIAWTDPKIVDQLTKWAALKTKGCTNEDVLANNESVSQFEIGQGGHDPRGLVGLRRVLARSSVTRSVSSSPPFNDTPTKGVVEFPGNGFGDHQLLPEQAGRGQLPGLDGDPRGPEDHRRRRAHPDRRRHGADQRRWPSRCSTTRQTRAITRYPMIDNVMQPEVTDVATKLLDAVLAGTTSPQEAAQEIQDALMAAAGREARRHLPVIG